MKTDEKLIGYLNETIQEFHLQDTFRYNGKIENGVFLFERDDCYEAYFCNHGRVTWESITYDFVDACIDAFSKLLDGEEQEDAISYFEDLVEEPYEKVLTQKSTR